MLSRFVLGLLLISFSFVGSTYGDYVTMVDNGPSANRVDVVFLGDGYTASQLNTTYVMHIDRMLDHMFDDAEDPFPRYEQFFNVHRVNVESNESGADVPPDGVFRDTALDASYYFDGATDRLLYIDSAKADAQIRTNIGRAFQVDMRLVTVNDPRYGGGGGSYAVYSGGNFSAPEVALHELGHSFAGLADEYGGDPGVYPGGEPFEPNLTKDANGEKWSQWLGYEEPGMGTIGAYEGGGYYDEGIYRPSENSKMRTLNNKFDAVSREEIILDIYDLVNPLDAWLANSATVNNPTSLWVDAIDPEVIDVRWLVNGIEVLGATGETFNPRAFGLLAGDYEITAFAEDLTPWVRIEREKLQQSVSWNVHLDLLEPLLGDANGDGVVDLTDLNLVRNHFGQVGVLIPGDTFPFDGVVDLADMNAVRNNFSLLGGILVPEPSSYQLAAVLVCALTCGLRAMTRGERKR